jgi:hypothetical protein
VTAPTQDWQATGPIRFTMILPPGWIRFDLDHPPTGDRMLAAVVGAARSQHASLCALYAEEVDSTIISASVLAATVRANEAIVRDGTVDIESLRSQVADVVGGSCPLDCRVVELSAGSAVRLHALPEVMAEGEVVRADNVQFYVPAPGADAILIVTFSTPSQPLAEAFGELFDAVADSIEWVW